MNNNQFRKAAAILFPNVVFNFMKGVNTYSAFAQGAHEGQVNLFAKKDGDTIKVQQRGEDTAVHDINTVLESQAYPPDPFTAEQETLERLRGVINALKETTFAETDYAHSDYRNGFIEGSKEQHDLILTMLEAALKG